MTGPERSALRRDLELIDAALLATVSAAMGPDASGEMTQLERTLCRLAAQRVLATAETLQGVVGREPAAARRGELVAALAEMST